MPSPLQRAIDLRSRGAAERPCERAPEIVAQKRVENRIDSTVSVAEDGDELVERH